MEASIDPKLVARSKESGKLVYFKTPQAKDAAMKAGTHEDPKAKKADTPKASVKPNSMFGGDYPVGSLQYRLQKNNPKDAVKYDNQSKSPTHTKIGDNIEAKKDKQTGIIHLKDTNTYGGRIWTNTSILPNDISTMIKHLSQPNPIKFRIGSVNSIYKDTFVTKSKDGISIKDKSKKGWPSVNLPISELPNLIKYLEQNK